MGASGTRCEGLEARAYTFPTDEHESDGTLAWDSTTCVVVRVHAAGVSGLGYTYGPAAIARLIEDELGEIICGADAMSPRAAWYRMLAAVRNMGRPGIAAHAISAVDVALWDLKARLLELPLAQLWGRVRERVPLYASGGFTSYGEDRLRAQLRGWVEEGMRQVKIKVGRRPENDLQRVELARELIGPEVQLFVDANEAYERKQALAFAEAFARHDVTWFEQPVRADDLEGLRLLRDRAPAGMRVSSGEYGYHPRDFRRLLEAGAVDVLQADVTRCLGFTGFFAVAALCEAWAIPLSSHTAPALHAHLGVALGPVIHAEYFHDHVGVEARLFEGAPSPVQGTLAPRPDALGHGLALTTTKENECRW